MEVMECIWVELKRIKRRPTMNPERKVQSRRREEPCTVINEALV
jgi:hypothetical protein